LISRASPTFLFAAPSRTAGLCFLDAPELVVACSFRVGKELQLRHDVAVGG
jgi:hypothetical protein